MLHNDNDILLIYLRSSVVVENVVKIKKKKKTKLHEKVVQTVDWLELALLRPAYWFTGRHWTSLSETTVSVIVGVGQLTGILSLQDLVL